MKYRIRADEDGGFSVQMMGPDGKTVLADVSGFATHESAQGFIRDIFIGLMQAFRTAH